MSIVLQKIWLKYLDEKLHNPFVSLYYTVFILKNSDTLSGYIPIYTDGSRETEWLLLLTHLSLLFLDIYLLMHYTRNISYIFTPEIYYRQEK